MRDIKFLTNENIFLNNSKCKFLNFMNKRKKTIDEDSLPEFASLGRVIIYNYIFLKKIVSRILSDVKMNNEYWDAYYKLCDPQEQGLILTKDDKEILSKCDEPLEEIHLDVADFFIHAGIFMDQLCRVSCFFSKDQFKIIFYT